MNSIMSEGGEGKKNPLVGFFGEVGLYRDGKSLGTEKKITEPLRRPIERPRKVKEEKAPLCGGDRKLCSLSQGEKT